MGIDFLHAGFEWRERENLFAIFRKRSLENEKGRRCHDMYRSRNGRKCGNRYVFDCSLVV
jgi:hypothetical protein